MKKKIGRLIPGGIFIFVSTLIIILAESSFFESLEFKAYDSKVNYASEYNSPCDDIMIIMVDQYSIDRASDEYGWSWPWPRDAYGDIYRFLDIAQAESCSFDILFTEPSIYGDEDDEAFAGKLASGTHTKSFTAQFWDGEDSISDPIDLIAESVTALSNTTSAKDSDGIIRRTRYHDTVNDKDIFAMGFRPVADKNGKLTKKVPFKFDREKNTQTVKLNYKGDIDLYAHYSAFDILDCLQHIENEEEYEDFSPADFKNAHVFVIYYAPGLFDICSTPVSKVYPGAGVPITALDNYIKNDFITDIPLWLYILLIYTCGFYGAYAAYFSGKRKSTKSIIFFNTLFFSAGVFMITFGTYRAFVHKFDVPFVSLISSFIFSFIAMSSADYFSEGKQKRFIKSAFSQYLSPSVINQLILNPENLKLGGEKRTISIFFSDVQSFTTLSEGLSPEKLTELLNTYLSEMTAIILETGGTIDKYEGDAIIAFWNAPADIPDHGKKALEAAVKCQERLAQLEESFIAKVGRPMWTRIGINTGDAVVGNMGSQNRFDYTMFGDSVNLASRLEGLNKQFGTYLMCSESTMKHAGESNCALKFRQLGRVQVIGKKQAVTVYEPMSAENYEAKKIELNRFQDALELFYKGKLQDALKIFEENTDDAPSRKYAEKINEILDSRIELSDEWQGIWIAKEK